MKRRYLLMAATWVLGGCTSLPKVQPTGLDPAVFWTDQGVRREQMKRLTAKVRLRYRSKKENVAGNGRLLAQAPGNLRLELRDPFGKLHYLVTLRGEDFTAEYPGRHIAYLDKRAGNAYLKRALGLAVSFGELQSFLVGSVPESFAASAKFETWDWDPERGAYRGTLTAGNRRLTSWIDPQKGMLRAATLQTGNDKVAVTYSDFGPCCRRSDDRGNSGTTAMAQLVEVSVQGGGTGVELEWEEVNSFEGSKPAQVFQSSLPEGMRRIFLE